MPQLKKILITLPVSLLLEVDSIAGEKNISRSRLIRDALKLYADAEMKAEMKKKMIKGYQEMGELNLQLAEICFEADQQQLDRYEEKLAECE